MLIKDLLCLVYFRHRRVVHFKSADALFVCFCKFTVKLNIMCSFNSVAQNSRHHVITVVLHLDSFVLSRGDCSRVKLSPRRREFKVPMK